jgi:acyl-CoA thioesterase I
MNKPKIVCIGDSITEGYGIDQNNRWTNQLEYDLKTEIINSGIVGDTTTGMLARFRHDVINHKPTHVIILGGNNDLWFGLNSKFVISNFQAMCWYAIHYNIIPIVGLPTPFYADDLNLNSENYSEVVANFHSELKRYCIEKEHYVIDFSKHLIPEHFLDDGLHPNKEGHRKIKENTYETLRIFIEF